jgi:uncharacterized protein YkwD
MPRLFGPIVTLAGLCLLLAGCPTENTTGGLGLPAFLASGGPGGSTSSPTTPTNSGSDPNSTGSSTAGAAVTSGDGVQSGGAVSGSTAGVATPDALTITYAACQEPFQAGIWREDILRLVNQERANGGLAAVTWNQTLADEAADYACQMIQYNYFDHVNPVTGSTLRERARQFGYDYWIIGENLAAGQRSAVEAVTAWMNSPCHRENIMNPAFTELGIAVRYGGTYGYYWVQEFGRPFSGPNYAGPSYHDPDCTH